MGNIIKLALLIFLAAQAVCLNFSLLSLVKSVDSLRMSYSSHNNIECREVQIFHSENYDVAEGLGAIREKGSK